MKTSWTLVLTALVLSFVAIAWHVTDTSSSRPLFFERPAPSSLENFEEDSAPSHLPGAKASIRPRVTRVPVPTFVHPQSPPKNLLVEADSEIQRLTREIERLQAILRQTNAIHERLDALVLGHGLIHEKTYRKLLDYLMEPESIIERFDSFLLSIVHLVEMSGLTRQTEDDWTYRSPLEPLLESGQIVLHVAPQDSYDQYSCETFSLDIRLPPFDKDIGWEGFSFDHVDISFYIQSLENGVLVFDIRVEAEEVPRQFEGAELSLGWDEDFGYDLFLHPVLGGSREQYPADIDEVRNWKRRLISFMNRIRRVAGFF